ncbi:MAG: hypothetical protein KBT47_06370 [Armatimonadetes bacterium]|nr:hypothetical protein [Candidatus Hippobium faecium]
MKSKVSYRIETNFWRDEKHFGRLLSQLERYKDRIDEVSLFLNWTHSSMPIDYIEKFTDIAKDRIEKIKSLGLKCGINHLTTIGHHRENDAGRLLGDYSRHIFYSGEEGGDLCVSDPKVMEYIGRTYEIIAKANPDYIWMDDDVGMTHHYNCFCPLCLKLFGEIAGREYSREELLKDLESDFDLRKKWYDFYTGKVNKVIKTVREALDRVNPDIVLGLMSADYDYEETDKDIQSDIMSRNGETDTKWRPGCGVYTDDRQDDFCQKISLIGRLTESIPHYVMDIQSEIENFPYNHINKSVKFNLAETVAYMGSGCTGVAYNVLRGVTPGADYDVTGENERRFEILKYRPFFDYIAENMGREPNKGIWQVRRDKKSLWKNDSLLNWIRPDRLDKKCEMFFNGLPMAYRQSHVTFLDGKEVYNLSDREIAEILKGGVCMYGEALKGLTERGFGKYLGFECDRLIERDGLERFGFGEINRGFENLLRDCRMSFWRDGEVWTVKKTEESAEYLSGLENYEQEFLGYGSGIYENSLGGRVCVLGYYPNMYVQDYAQSVRLKRIFSWLSRNTLSYLKSYHKGIFFDRGMFLFVSDCLDDQRDVEFALGGNFDNIRCINENMEEKNIAVIKDENYTYVTVDILKPFETIAIK